MTATVALPLVDRSVLNICEYNAELTIPVILDIAQEELCLDRRALYGLSPRMADTQASGTQPQVHIVSLLPAV